MLPHLHIIHSIPSSPPFPALRTTAHLAEHRGHAQVQNHVSHDVSHNVSLACQSLITKNVATSPRQGCPRQGCTHTPREWLLGHVRGTQEQTSHPGPLLIQLTPAPPAGPHRAPSHHLGPHSSPLHQISHQFPILPLPPSSSPCPTLSAGVGLPRCAAATAWGPGTRG